MGALSALKKAKPLVSKFDEALANLQRPKGTGNEFLTEVMKQAGVKKAEIEDRKLKQAFEKAGKITKEQAQEIARKNASPKIEEKILTEQGEKFGELEKMAERDYGQAFEDLHPSIQDEIEKEFDSAAAQYGEYRMPGGSNYREIIMKLPSMPDAEKERLMQLEAKHRRLSEPAQWVFEDSAEGKEMKALKDKANQSAYYSSHWGKDEANPLAHMRVQDRVGPNGEKILHVEEIQSDWHQAGRKNGYQNPDVINAYAEYEKALPERAVNKITQMFIDEGTDPERARMLAEKQLKTILSMSRERNLGPSNMAAILGEEKQMKSLWDAALAEKDKVPDAPFKKNWHELAMKRLINHAAENGYDKIAITPGAEQASRYKLSQHVGSVSYDPETQHFQAFKPNRETITSEKGVGPDRVAELIGKEAAEKLLQSPQTMGHHYLEGESMDIGGEGMKGFYDKMLPDYLNTLGKKYGAQVGVYDMPNPKTGLSITDIQREQGMTDQQWLDLSGDEKMRLIDEMDAKAKAHKTPLHSFDITPELREEVTTKGLPLYQQIGLPLGAGTAAEGLGLPSVEPEYAAGGAVNYNTDPDMSDGGEIIQGAPYKKGGKVRIADNLDEMFMEVNNKKFQRK